MVRTILGWLLMATMATAAHAADINKPLSPGENDQLIKHYMDSKDPRYLQTMLQTYAEADDAMLHDARRYAFLIPMANSTDPKNPRPNMKKTVAVALCQKYSCAPDPQNSRPFMQMMTAASGMWALDSLSRQDPQIKKIVEDFLAGNERLRLIYAEEAQRFSNYMTLTIMAAVKPEMVDGLLTKYEQHGILDMEEVKKTLDMKPLASKP